MKKLLSLTLLAIICSFASYAIYPIVGSAGSCVGAYGYVSDSTIGGLWSSSNPSIATVGSTSGAVLGISAGTITITYTVGSSYVTAPYVVTPAPAAIAGGPLSGCVGYSGTLTDATPGGTWSSSAPSVCAIGSGTGILSGLSAGYAYIYYTVGPGCSATTYDTVYAPVTPDSITGPTNVCVGSTITLHDITFGGTWSSSNPSVATISSTGVVTGVSSGTVVIDYTVSGPCGSAYAAYAVTVSSITSPGTITGASSVAVGSNTTLTDAVTGGTWVSSNTSVATVGATTGIVTGVSTGSVVISYLVTGCSGFLSTTHPMTVTGTVNRISGHIYFTGPAVDTISPIKIWLIHYDPTTHLLTAVDSQTTYSGGTSAYYYFTTSATTDSFRVKAAIFPATFSTTGYIPTYHTASFYWNSATVISHTNPSTDDNKDITMAYGTVTSGPGFIAGDVTTGANKGTSGTIPAVNMLMLCLNSSGVVLQQTYTDAAGHYSFSNLPVGTYTIYPEAINYATTAFSGINLTTSSPSMTSASFGQHSISKTILPRTTGITNVSGNETSVVVFPNPSNGKLNIQSTVNSNEKANVTVADITGRIVYAATVNFAAGTAVNQIDISTLNNGVYMINVKSASVNYNSKIQVQH